MRINKFISNENLTYLIALLIFSVLSLTMIINHEPWRDEAESWLIAKDSPDVISLTNMVHYEGTPGLWYHTLFWLNKFNLNYFSMLLIHFLIILAAAAIFLYYSPFSKTVKILFIFGYYLLYEYNVVARHYSLSVLFLFVIAALYDKRFQKPILYGISLLLLAYSNLHGFLFAGLLFCLYIYETIFQKNYKIDKKHYYFFAIMIIGFLLGFVQLLPPPDLSPWMAKWNTELSQEHLGRIPGTFLGAFFPLPQFKITFWNTKLIYLISNKLAILGFLFFLASLLFFIRKPKILLIYLIFSLGLVSIGFLKQTGGYRHNGLIYIAFIFFLWISKDYSEKQYKNKFLDRFSSEDFLSMLLAILLIAQLISSLAPFYYEVRYDFSGGKKAADFLIKNDFINNETFIAAYRSDIVQSVVPYLPDDYKLYFIEYSDFRISIIRNEELELNSNISYKEVADRIDGFVKGKDYKNVLLVTEKNVDEKDFLEKYNMIAYFNETIAESVYVYELKQ